MKIIVEESAENKKILSLRIICLGETLLGLQ